MSACEHTRLAGYCQRCTEAEVTRLRELARRAADALEHSTGCPAWMSPSRECDCHTHALLAELRAAGGEK